MKTENATAPAPTLEEARENAAQAQIRLMKAKLALVKTEAETPVALHLPAAEIAAGSKPTDKTRRAYLLRVANGIVSGTLSPDGKPLFSRPEQVSTEAGRVIARLGKLAGFSAGEQGDESQSLGKGKGRAAKVGFAAGFSLSQLAQACKDSGHASENALGLAAALASVYRRVDSAQRSAEAATKAFEALKAKTPATEETEAQAPATEATEATEAKAKPERKRKPQAQAA